MNQLRYTGMLETTRIRREGFPFRVLFHEFYQQFRGLAFPFTDRRAGDKNACIQVLRAAEELATALNISHNTVRKNVGQWFDGWVGG